LFACFTGLGVNHAKDIPMLRVKNIKAQLVIHPKKYQGKHNKAQRQTKQIQIGIDVSELPKNKPKV
jgi:hypothetical protein